MNRSTSVLFLVHILTQSTASALLNYHPPRCPEEYQDKLCSCDEGSKKERLEEPCHLDILSSSKDTYTWLQAAIEGWKYDNRCDRPEKAFRESILTLDKRDRLTEFVKKLERCQNGEIDTVSIAIFGGSETAGAYCHPKYQFHPPATTFLNLPKLNLPIVLGDSHCPWSNRLFSLLKEKYPKCEHVDVYNFAFGGTEQLYGLDRLSKYFKAEESARGGLKLGEVVDLVLIDYGVNEGVIKLSSDLDELGLDHTEDNFVAKLEAVTEYFIRYVLNDVPSKPALMYIAAASGENNQLISLLPYLDACRRFGVPLVSARHFMSYPDNPCWVAFVEREGAYYRTFEEGSENELGVKTATASVQKKHKDIYKTAKFIPNGIYHDIDRYSPSGKYEPSIGDTIPLHHDAKRAGGMKSAVGYLPLKEGKDIIDPNTHKKRDHNLLSCWGKKVHPGEQTHALMAEMMFYSIHVTAKASEVMSSICMNEDGQPGSHHFFHSNTSENAVKFNQVLNPLAQCPNGPLVEYDSAELYLNNKVNISILNENNVKSGWSLKSDRPGKYGFILENSYSKVLVPSSSSSSPLAVETTSSTEETIADREEGETLRFDIQLSLRPHISIEYLHSYENAGKIEIFIEQNHMQKTRSGIKSIIERKNGVVPIIKPGSSLVLDSYVPEIKYALYTDFQFNVLGYQPGKAVLVVRRYSEDISEKEMIMRGGDRFKLVGVTSC